MRIKSFIALLMCLCLCAYMAYAEEGNSSYFHSTGTLSDFDLEQYCVLGGTAPVALVSFGLQKDDIETLLGADYEYRDLGFSRYMEYGLCYFMGYWGNLVFSLDNDEQLKYIEIEGELRVGGYDDAHTEIIIERIKRLTGIDPKVGHFEGTQYKFITPYIEYLFDSYYTRSTARVWKDRRKFDFRVFPGEEILSINDKDWNTKLGLNTPYSNY